MKKLNSNSGNEELMAYFESERANANGEGVGNESDTPSQAAQREGWTVLRQIEGRSNGPVLAEDARQVDETLYIVCDVNGPWAVFIRDLSVVASRGKEPV